MSLFNKGKKYGSGKNKGELEKDELDIEVEEFDIDDYDIVVEGEGDSDEEDYEEVEVESDSSDEDDSDKEETFDELVNNVVNYFTTIETEWVNSYELKKISKEAFMNHVKEYIESRVSEPRKVDMVLREFEAAIWSYGVLDRLINDDSISDIKAYGPDNVRIKRNGHREDSNVRFADRNAYVQYVNRVAVRNKINISNQNAMQSFVDKEGNKDYILRIDIVTGFLESRGLPILQIRKIRKHKYTTKQLLDFGYFTLEEIEYLKDKVKNSDGLLFCGKGGAGKTIGVNWCLDELPEDISGLVIQENEELTTKHKDISLQHTIENRGEGKIEYTLQDLAKNALLLDLDYIIIGEIKGGEAVYLLNAVYTGHKGWATVHAASSTEALDKLVDYIMYNSNYSKSEALKMLVHLQTIVFVKNFRIEEISEVAGFDDSTGRIIYKTVFKSGKRVG